jgi:hypothetical protein
VGTIVLLFPGVDTQKTAIKIDLISLDAINWLLIANYYLCIIYYILAISYLGSGI